MRGKIRERLIDYARRVGQGITTASLYGSNAAGDGLKLAGLAHLAQGKFVEAGLLAGAGVILDVVTVGSDDLPMTRYSRFKVDAYCRLADVLDDAATTVKKISGNVKDRARLAYQKAN